jgi:hypothetical protein
MVVRATFALLLAGCLAGCADSSKPYQTAPVSGVVTLDGTPLAGARVTFMPVPGQQRQMGPESGGETGSDGRYTLETVFGDSGASVGKNRVMISTRKVEPNPANPDRPTEIAKERIPNKYFTEQAPLVFDVPAAGTNAANFELTTR